MYIRAAFGKSTGVHCIREVSSRVSFKTVSGAYAGSERHGLGHTGLVRTMRTLVRSTQ